MKYAIVECGGKQYKAVEDAAIEVDLMDVDPGKKVTLDSVLLVADGEKVSVGAPMVKGAKVEAEVLEHIKGPKLVIFKYRPKQRYRVKTGHRQQYTRLEVKKIIAE